MDKNNIGYQLLRKSGWNGDEGKTEARVVAQGREGLGRREREAEMEGATKQAKTIIIEQKQRRKPTEFYCETCDKQYKTVSEFSTHLSSYDHHHRKRFKEMSLATKEKKKRKRDDDNSVEIERRRAAAAAAALEIAPPTALNKKKTGIKINLSLKPS